MDSEVSSRWGWLGAIALAASFLACQSNPNLLQRLEQEITQVADQVAPSVISIVATDPHTGERRMGGGVSIEPDVILTTENLLGDASQVEIMQQNGQKIDTNQIDMVCADYETNICFIKLKSKILKPVSCSESEPLTGSIGIVVGNSVYSKGLDVSYGTLANSWIGGDDPYDNPLLTLHVSLGENSGGMPVFNSEGKLIGITEGMIQGIEHLSLVLPARTCVKVKQAMAENHGQIKRGWIGVFIGHACPLGTVGEGVDKEKIAPNMIAQLAEGSLAKKAGFKPGDLILACQGNEIKTAKDLRQIISRQAPGSQVEIVAWRNGHKFTARVEVGRAPVQQSLRRCISRSI